MLVDLGRNDIGKISEFGSVSVEKYHTIERYSHVMHIGSTVRGTIMKDRDVLDTVSAILPAGTLSGAPKIRACQIINSLDNNKRGIYGGWIGYIDFSGNLDLCIAIRIAYKKNGKVFICSGAGIVADSVPASEYNECLNKVAGEAVQAGARTVISWGNAAKVALVGGFSYLFLTGGASNVVSRTLGISEGAAQILIIFGFIVIMILVTRYLINYVRNRFGL
jgi:hypothetical protein